MLGWIRRKIFKHRTRLRRRRRSRIYKFHRISSPDNLPAYPSRAAPRPPTTERFAKHPGMFSRSQDIELRFDEQTEVGSAIREVIASRPGRTKLYESLLSILKQKWQTPEEIIARVKRRRLQGAEAEREKLISRLMIQQAQNAQQGKLKELHDMKTQQVAKCDRDERSQHSATPDSGSTCSQDFKETSSSIEHHQGTRDQQEAMAGFRTIAAGESLAALPDEGIAPVSDKLTAPGFLSWSNPNRASHPSSVTDYDVADFVRAEESWRRQLEEWQRARIRQELELIYDSIPETLEPLYQQPVERYYTLDSSFI